MNAVLILEDLPTLEGQNKSLDLARKVRERLSRRIHAVWLYNGQTCSRVKPNGQLQAPSFQKARRAPAADFARWAATKFANHEILCMIVDLKFGQDGNYGYDVFVEFSNRFRGIVEPVVYSRWVSEDNREAEANRFGVPGERVLQRDMDSQETVCDRVDQILP